MVKKTGKVKRILFACLTGIMAVTVLIIAIFLFWWYGAFLPSWIQWKEAATDYEGGYVTLKDKRLTFYADVSQKRVLWSSEKDWFVQDLVIKDLDGDNVEELIALVWKHGSFGKYMPAWIKENDKRLEQHIFIYSFDKGRDTGIHALWMSSRLGSDITSIASGKGDRLIVSRKGREPSMWRWQGFGLYSAEAPQDVSLRVCCAGDNLIHLSLLGDDLSEVSLYDEIAPEISGADISVINLETILVDDIRKISDYPRFGTPLVVGEALAQAGFDVINLANNHVLDQGDYGLRTTTAFFGEKGIPCFGACAKSDYRDSIRGRMLLVEKSGVRIAFLGYTYGTNGMDLPDEYPYLTETFSDPERMARQLDYARNRADVVIVYAHWGTEYKKDPDEEQILFAKLMAEHGVDVVIGCHPHVLQESSAVTPEGVLESGLPAKITEGDHVTAVYFSLGNFIAAQSGEDTKTGGLAEFTIEKRADGSVSIGDFDLVKTQIVKSDAGYRVTLK